VSIVYFTLATVAVPCNSQEESSGPTFADLQSRFDEAAGRINQPIAQLNASYREALKRLFASETAAGKLDEALQVKLEMGEFLEDVDFTPESINSKPTDHPTIQKMRLTYLAERERLWNLNKKTRDELLRNYLAALISLEQEHTKLGNFDAAVSVRNTRMALGQDARFHDGTLATSAPVSFPAQIHFVAKGEVEIRLKGAKLSYKNTSPDRKKYIDGTGSNVTLSVGDIIVVSMRATAVFRGLVMTIESEDRKMSVPVKANDYCYLGGALDQRDLNPDIETLGKITMRPEGGSPDPEMSTMWSEKSISDLSRSGSEWIKCGPGEDWHHYAVHLQSEMLLPVSD